MAITIKKKSKNFKKNDEAKPMQKNVTLLYMTGKIFAYYEIVR